MKKIIFFAILIACLTSEIYAQVTPSSHKVLENGTVIIDTYQNVARSRTEIFRDSCQIKTIIKKDGTTEKSLIFNSCGHYKGNYMAVYSYFIHPDTLVNCEVTLKKLNGTIKKDTLYQVRGRSSITRSIYSYKIQKLQKIELIINWNDLKETKIFWENTTSAMYISEAFYNELKKIFGNQIKYVSRKREETEDDPLDYIF